VDGVKMQFAGPATLSLLTVINGWLARWGGKRIIAIYDKHGGFLEFQVEDLPISQ
jgi:hypothetical protein